MITKTKPLQGQELIDELSARGLAEAPAATGLYNVHTPEEMVAAQEVLLENGYYLTRTDMMEGHVYLQTFASPRSNQWPYWITLRYIVNDTRQPWLVLASFADDDHRRTVVYNRRQTMGTGTSEAERVLSHFKHEFPDRQPFWLPAFEGSPLLRG